jgi:hypothetical protein
MGVRIRILLLGAAVAVTLLAIAPAPAVPPQSEPLPPLDASFPAGFVCPFAMTVRTDISKAKATTHFDQEGNITRIQVSGHVVQTLTNDETDESVTLNTSGAATIYLREDGSLIFIGRGHGLALNLPTDSPPSTALFIKGHAELTIEPDGRFVLGEVKGNVTNMCELLA